MKFLTIFFAGLLFALPVRAQPVEPVERVIERVIRPGFMAFAQTGKTMREATQALCSKPSQKSLDDARAAFSQLVEQWSRIELIRLGPLSTNLLSERILFWPDRRGRGLRQVQAALANEARDVIDPDRLAGKSVAFQGLGALEFLLYGSGADTLALKAGHRCAFASAVSQTIAKNAKQASDGWQDGKGYSKLWSRPGAENRIFRTRDETLAALLKQAAVGFEIVRELRARRLLPPRGRPASHKRALFWRSGLTLVSLRANIEGLAAFLNASRVTSLLENPEEIDSQLAFDTKNALRVIGGVTLPLEQAVTDPKAAASFAYLVTVIGFLQNLIGNDLATELGTGTGFSSLDGD